MMLVTFVTRRGSAGKAALGVAEASRAARRAQTQRDGWRPSLPGPPSPAYTTTRSSPHDGCTSPQNAWLESSLETPACFFITFVHSGRLRKELYPHCKGEQYLCQDFALF